VARPGPIQICGTLARLANGLLETTLFVKSNAFEIAAGTEKTTEFCTMDWHACSASTAAFAQRVLTIPLARLEIVSL